MGLTASQLVKGCVPRSPVNELPLGKGQQPGVQRRGDMGAHERGLTTCCPSTGVPGPLWGCMPVHDMDIGYRVQSGQHQGLCGPLPRSLATERATDEETGPLKVTTIFGSRSPSQPSLLILQFPPGAHLVSNGVAGKGPMGFPSLGGGCRCPKPSLEPSRGH